MFKHSRYSSGHVSAAAGRRLGPQRHHLWAAAAVVLMTCGVIASVLAAQSAGASDADKALKSFQRSSASVASTLQLAIQHDNDVVADAGGLLANPNLTPTEFASWATAGRVLDRYPEMAGIGSLVVVDASALPAWTTRSLTRSGWAPWALTAASPSFRRAPVRSTASRRPAYRATRPRPRQPAFDYCADPTNSAALLGARDSGQGAYVPYTAEWRHIAGRRDSDLPRGHDSEHGRGPAGSIRRLGRHHRQPGNPLEPCVTGRPGSFGSDAVSRRCTRRHVQQRPSCCRRAGGNDRPAQRMDGADVRTGRPRRHHRRPTPSPCCSPASRSACCSDC